MNCPPYRPSPSHSLRLRPCAVHDCKNLLAISHNCQCDVATNCGNMLHTRPDKPWPQPKIPKKTPRSGNVAPAQCPTTAHSLPRLLLLSNMAHLKLFDVLPFPFAAIHSITQPRYTHWTALLRFELLEYEFPLKLI